MLLLFYRENQMNYRKNRNGEPISILGYGCMRFTKNGNSIDIDKAEREVARAVEFGVNYFDTAYIYPGSEVAVGEIFKRLGCREKVNIATKLPQYLIKSSAALDKYFNEQLQRLQTDYVDYYLMHMITDIAAWEKLKRLGIEEWIERQKSSGRIRNIGFSFHGNTEMFLKVLNAYDWDFCQIQYNYLDEDTQAGRRGLQAAAAKGIPVVIMAPLRGGKLVELLPEPAKRLIADAPEKNGRKLSAADWGYRWLWDQPEVTCVLSGMNSMQMVEENALNASEASVGEFTEVDFAMIEDVKNEINKNVKVNCTGCNYCVPCPQGIDIPLAFRCWNRMYTENKMSGRKEYLQIMALQKDMPDAGACTGCGKCARHCPQHIDIPAELKKARGQLAPLPVRLALRAVRVFKFW